MKINLSTVLIGATIAFLLLKPQVVMPIIPLPDEPLPDDPNVIDPVKDNVVDVYTTGNDGAQIYHHTEKTNPDGTVDIYVIDSNTGDLVYLKPKPIKDPKQQTVSGIGRNARRKIGAQRTNIYSAAGTKGMF